jgi:putative ABC transport system permease protein
MKTLLLILKNLRRNILRLTLTMLAIILLAVIFTMLQSVLGFLEAQMTEKSENIQLVVTERLRLPSRFPIAEWRQITEGGRTYERLKMVPGFDPEKQTVWHFAAFTLDPREDVKGFDPTKSFFVIGTYPEKLASMVDGLENEVPPGLIDKMKNPPKTQLPNTGIVMGERRLKALGLEVGQVIEPRTLFHFDGNKKPIKMQFEVVGSLPDTNRWTEGAFMDYAYMDRKLNTAKSEYDGLINLGWLRVKDQATASEVIRIIEEEHSKGATKLKCETAATAISRFLEPFKAIFWGVKYLLMPAILVVMVVIIANAISITVRERTKEIAVMKVLGFSRSWILVLVLGEALLVGAAAGLIGSAGTLLVINKAVGGIWIPIGFFPRFYIPLAALWWGPALGGATALMGSIIPAWNGCRIKVSEVFSKVT